MFFVGNSKPFKSECGSLSHRLAIRTDGSAGNNREFGNFLDLPFLILQTEGDLL